MGTHNRDRRRRKQSKKRPRRDGRSATPGRSIPLGSDDADELVDRAILAAARAEVEGLDEGRRNSLFELLAQGSVGACGCEVVAQRVTRLIGLGVAHALQRGWAHGEVHLVVRRNAGASGAAIVAGPLAAEPLPDQESGASATQRSSWRVGAARELNPSSPSWRDDLSKALAVLCLVLQLPPMPRIDSVTAPSRTVGTGEDERILTRIRGLLNKAESSNFAEEADAFMAKAQELMTRHCIDRVMVEFEAEGDELHDVETRRVWLEEPYLEAKSLLLAHVASANRCRSIVDTVLGFSTLVGDRSDIDATELIFTSLLMQATRRITRLGSDPVLGDRTRKPSYRRSFLVAYAQRIGARLREAAAETTASVDDACGNRLLPVLAHREEMLDAAVKELFGELKRMQFSISNAAGWAAGTAAAERAELGVHGELATHQMP